MVAAAHIAIDLLRDEPPIYGSRWNLVAATLDMNYNELFVEWKSTSTAIPPSLSRDVSNKFVDARKQSSKAAKADLLIHKTFSCTLAGFEGLLEMCRVPMHHCLNPESPPSRGEARRP